MRAFSRVGRSQRNVRNSRGTTSHLLDCRLKLSLALGMTGGGVDWEDGEDGDTEKRRSPPMALITWLFGLWGRRGLICVGGTESAWLGSVLGGSVGKSHQPTQEMLETRVRSLGWEDPRVKGTATHSNILAWRTPWTEEPGGLQSTGSGRIGDD